MSSSPAQSIFETRPRSLYGVPPHSSVWNGSSMPGRRGCLHFSDGNIAVGLPLLRVGQLIGNIADLRIFSMGIEPLPFFGRQYVHLFLEGLGDGAAHRKLDPFFVTVRKEVVSISCRIRAEAHLHSFRQIIACFLEDPEKIVVGRDVAVSKLGMDKQSLFGPVNTERLVGPVPFVG